MRPPVEDQEYPEPHHRHSSHRGSSRRDHVVTSTVIVGVILFLVFGAPYLKHHLSLDGSLLNAINGGDSPSDRRSADEPIHEPSHDRVRESDRISDRDSIHDAESRPTHVAFQDLNHDSIHNSDPHHNPDPRPVRDAIHDADRDRDHHPVREPIRESRHEPAGQSARDADRDAVHRWLRANSDNSHPHEIRWWPARELSKLYQDRLEAARDAADDDPTLASEVAEIEEDGPDRVCRLKYRTKNNAGEETTCDDFFIVRQGQVRRIAKNSSLASAARRYFPDSDGRP